MSNRFAIVLIVLIAIFGGIFVVSKKKADAPTSSGNSAQASKHTLGDNAKQITLVEYGDFECPACTAYYPIIKEVVEKHKADISFQFVNYPLSQIHPNAMAAHRAAEAANAQGKFWEMYDTLYGRNAEWKSLSSTSSTFEGYAQQLGLDVTKFKADAASSATNDVIQADIKQGQKLNVNATPTFFLNGKKLDEPPRDVEGFNKLIEDAIAAKATS